MPSVLIRNLPEATHRALKHRAAAKGTSTEAEVRTILEQAIHPPERIKMGQELAKIGRKLNLPPDFEVSRDKTPAGSTVSFK